jgi:SAM-dependent methyltransferase
LPGTDLWERWAARWERFQDAHVPCRRLQLRLIADYVTLARPVGPVRVLDVCCGTGSAGGELLRARDDVSVVGVDWDPWMLELGRRTASHSVTWVEADVTRDGWCDALGVTVFDAVVITTALQWLGNDEIRRLYEAIGRLLGQGGVFVISDRVPDGPLRVRRLSSEAQRRRLHRSTASPEGESWQAFWNDARAEPRFAELLAVREARVGARTPLAGRSLSLHERWLRAAGFGDVGEVWRCHESALLLAMRDG